MKDMKRYNFDAETIYEMAKSSTISILKYTLEGTIGIQVYYDNKVKIELM